MSLGVRFASSSAFFAGESLVMAFEIFTRLLTLSFCSSILLPNMLRSAEMDGKTDSASSSSLAKCCSSASRAAITGSRSSASLRSFRCISSHHSLRLLASSMAEEYRGMGANVAW